MTFKLFLLLSYCVYVDNTEMDVGLQHRPVLFIYFLMIGIETRALHTPGKHYISEKHS